MISTISLGISKQPFGKHRQDFQADIGPDSGQALPRAWAPTQRDSWLQCKGNLSAILIVHAQGLVTPHADLLAADNLIHGPGEGGLQLLGHLVERLHLQQRPALQELPEVRLVQAPAAAFCFSCTAFLGLEEEPWHCLVGNQEVNGKGVLLSCP